MRFNRSKAVYVFLDCKFEKTLCCIIIADIIKFALYVYVICLQILNVALNECSGADFKNL